jgi:hypothetical protein
MSIAVQGRLDGPGRRLFDFSSTASAANGAKEKWSRLDFRNPSHFPCRSTRDGRNNAAVRGLIDEAQAATGKVHALRGINLTPA